MICSAIANGRSIQRVVLENRGQMYGLRLTLDTPVVIQTRPELLSEEIPIGAKILTVNGITVKTGVQAVRILATTRTAQIDIEIPLNAGLFDVQAALF